MPNKIKLSTGHEIYVDALRLTYRKLKTLRVELRAKDGDEVNDSTILQAEIAKLQASPITEKALLETYYKLQLNAKPVDNSVALEDFSDKMKVACCYLKEGKKEVDLTVEEYWAMPWPDVQLIEKEYNKQSKAILPGATEKEEADFLP